MNASESMVVLHGMMGSPNDFYFLEESFDQSFIFLDIYQELRKSKANSFLEFIKYLKSSLSHLPSYSLLGYSLGGRLAQYLAQDNEKIRQLYLISSHPGLDSQAEQSQRISHDSTLLLNINGPQALKHFLNSWYSQELFGGKDHLKNFEKLIQARSIEFIEDWILGLKILGTGHQPLFSQLNLPLKTYYFFGQKDEKYSKLAQKIKAQFPKTTLIPIQNAYHALHIDNPSEFIQKLGQSWVNT